MTDRELRDYLYRINDILSEMFADLDAKHDPIDEEIERLRKENGKLWERNAFLEAMIPEGITEIKALDRPIPHENLFRDLCRADFRVRFQDEDSAESSLLSE